MTRAIQTPPHATPATTGTHLPDATAGSLAQAWEQRYRGLVDAINEIAWISDAEGNPVDPTGWIAFTGQTREEMERDGWYSCIHQDDLGPLGEAWRESMATGKPFESRVRLRRHDGVYRWFRGHSVPLRDDAGRIREWVGIARDIEAEHRTEEQLRVLNGRLLAVIRLQTEIAALGTDRDAIERHVAESVRHLVHADTVAVGRPDGDGFAYPNLAGNAAGPFHVPGAGSMTGWSVANRKAVRCDDMATDARAWASPRDDMRTRSGLWVPLMHGNETLGVLAALSLRPSAFSDDDLQVLSLLAGVLAIALANARAAEARADAHRILAFQAQLLANVEQAVFATDRDGRITYWNAAAEQAFGWTSAEAIGRLARELVIAPEGHGLSVALRERIIQGEPYSGDFEYVRRDGSRFIAHNSTATVQDDAGQVVGLIAVSRDVTKERALEDQLRQSQKMQAVGQLAGGVAHDFNNLLTAITSYAELLQEAVADEALRADIAEIRKAAARGADLTKQMLAFSRKQLVQPVVFDAGEAVRDFEKMLRRVISERVELDVAIADGALPLYADRTQLEQVVLNLVVNARDAIDGAGRIAVRLLREEAADGAGRLRLEVQDSGCGMSPETISRVFEPFFTTKPAGQGTGLGLSVVHGIVEQLHGSIAVDSAPGAGTRFTIRLPLAPAPSALPERTRVVTPREGGGERILLVEDNAALLALCRRVLRKQGYDIVAFESPQAALAAAQGQTFDLIVTDMVMPHMNGAVLVERLAAAGVVAPVLYVSGYTEEDVVHLDLETQGSSFLPKPFTPSELAERVREVLDCDRASSG